MLVLLSLGYSIITGPLRIAGLIINSGIIEIIKSNISTSTGNIAIRIYAIICGNLVLTAASLAIRIIVRYLGILIFVRLEDLVGSLRFVKLVRL